MPEKFHTVVVGLGAMGAASLYQLAKRGERVLGIDKYAPPHVYGSTHGDTRITRLASGEGAEYTAFARRSHEIWRDLEKQSGQSLLVQNGLLVISGDGPRASAHGKPAFLDATIDAARVNNVAYSVLSEADIRSRFSAFNIAANDRAYFEPEGGYLYPERCVELQLKLAKAHGGEIQTGETMHSFAQHSSYVEVVTDRGEYHADRLVVAAGPWLPHLLPQQAAVFTVRRQVLYWFALEDIATTAMYRPEAFPVFYWQLPRRQSIYGFPWIGDGEPAVKIATEQYDMQTTADAVERTVSEAETRATYDEYIAPFLRGVSSRAAKSAVCLYTCTGDARFVVDTLPEVSRVMVASPCSGHGFKHSAAIGEAIAEWATLGNATTLSLEQFRFAA